MDVLSIKYMFQWSYGYLQRYRFRIVHILFLSVALIFLNLCQVRYTQQMADAALAGQWALTVMAVRALLVVSAARMAGSYWYKNLEKRLEASVCCKIRNRLSDCLLAARLQKAEQISMGGLMQRYQEDAWKVSGFLLSGVRTWFFHPMMSLCGFFYLFNCHWKLSLGVFLPMPFLAVILDFFSRRGGKIYEEGCGIRSGYTDCVYDLAHGMETLAANRMQGWMYQKIAGFTEKIYANETAYFKNGCLSLAFIMSVTYVPNIMILVYGGFLAMRGEIGISLLFAYGQLVSQVSAPVIDLFHSLGELREMEASMRRLDEILLMEKEQEGTKTSGVSAKAAVCFQEVSFRYRESEERVLDQLSFAVQAGECIGITGESGAGKTTLFHLLCGFYVPDQGKIFIQGRQASEWKLSALRARMAYVSQENQVMPGTVRENIRYGRLGAREKEIEYAARLAGLDAFIRGLPRQYDTLLGENMDEWSGGQYQRLNLARAFLQNAEIYLFDEPTASLDEKNGQVVWESMQILKKSGKTVLIVSHQLELLELCDRVIVLKTGEDE